MLNVVSQPLVLVAHFSSPSLQMAVNGTPRPGQTITFFQVAYEYSRFVDDIVLSATMIERRRLTL